MSDHRVESGSVFEYCEEGKCYQFVGCLNGQTLAEFLSDYDDMKLAELVDSDTSYFG